MPETPEITRISEIAEELEFERSILRELLKQAPTAVIVMWGRELRFRYVSERALEFLPNGRELIGSAADDVFPNAAEAIEDVRVAVLDRGETVQVSDVPLAATGPAAWEGDRYYTFIAAPVEGPGGRPAGILNVGYETTADVRARTLLERELATEQRIATQLQVSLMPEQLPDVPGMDLASGFRPAGDGHEIGGDFYDVFPVSDGLWMVVMGDVCGKGAEAAAITALARYTMRAAAIRDGANPCTVLSRLNEALLRQREDLRFVSAVCGFLEPVDGGGATLSVCVAGHMPPLRVGADGTVTRVAGGHGVVLGIWDEPDLEQERVELAPGERLVLYTDGVLDADPAHELTEDAFADLLGQVAEGAANETVELIEREVVQGGALRGRDDVAVLVIRPHPGTNLGVMFEFLTRQKTEMPAVEDTLPGRDTAIVQPGDHAVLGTPMAPPFPDDTEQVIVGMGCFWGAEKAFWQLPGVYTTAVGYSGGTTPNPTYEEVCSGRTGQNEVVLVVYRPAEVSFEDVLKAFWEGHDPTQGMRQGNDVGTQYRSSIYTSTAAQAETVEASKAAYQGALDQAGRGQITTEIAAAAAVGQAAGSAGSAAFPFYYAEDYHQQYLHKVPNGYCGLGGTGVSCPVGLGA